MCGAFFLARQQHTTSEPANTRLFCQPCPWALPSQAHAQLLFLLPRDARNLFLARVVIRIDIVKLQGRISVNLHYDLAGGHRIVVHVRVEKGETAGGE